MPIRDTENMQSVNLEHILGSELASRFRTWRNSLGISISEATKILVLESLLARGIAQLEDIGELPDDDLKVYPIVCPVCGEYMMVDIMTSESICYAIVNRTAFFFYNGHDDADDKDVSHRALDVYCPVCDASVPFQEMIDKTTAELQSRLPLQEDGTPAHIDIKLASFHRFREWLSDQSTSML